MHWGSGLLSGSHQKLFLETLKTIKWSGNGWSGVRYREYSKKKVNYHILSHNNSWNVLDIADWLYITAEEFPRVEFSVKFIWLGVAGSARWLEIEKEWHLISHFCPTWRCILNESPTLLKHHRGINGWFIARLARGSQILVRIWVLIVLAELKSALVKTWPLE